MKVFHTFRLDTVNHCLWRGEERVALAPKAFDVLRYLVEHSDRLVTQDEILESLWPETYVNPEVVKKYVLGIRKVLGDQTNKPVFVATFPRRGYQFIAPVRDETASPHSGVTADRCRRIVGRGGALAQLEDALKRALQGQRQFVFITGEAGIGKTTLVDAFHQSAPLGPNVRMARGQCVEGFGGKEAYYPILDALGQLLREADDGPIVQAFSKQAPTWLVQFPSLVKAEQREALEKEIIGATRERMVREICETLESLTSNDPLVLVLEDLHWVDPSTLDFISALARRRGPAKLLLLGTYRPAEVIISQSPLKALKQDLVIHKLCHEIGLERLEESDVAEYLAIEFANGDFPAGFANLIYRHSGGNALFMVTILQDMVKKGLIAQTDVRWALTVPLEDVEPSVPETLDQLIEMQFEQLSEVEQGVLRTASVCGERFSVWAITTAADLDAASIEDVCEALAERQQFIKAAGIQELADGQFSAHYEFQHSLYREVLYRRLRRVTRSKLHLQLAQRLRALCDPCEQELTTELALHFEGGRDWEQAIRYLIVAAENAARRFAYHDSIEMLHHALELVPKVAPGNRMQLEIQTLVQIGDTQFALGNMADSAQTFERAASQAKQGALGAAQVTALIRLAHPLGMIDVDRCVATVEQAEQISASLNNPLLQARTQILAACVRLYYQTWRSEDAEICTAATETIQRLSGSGALQYPEMHYAHLKPLQGGYQEALQIAEAGILKIDGTTNTVSHLLAIGAKAVALMHMGRLGDSLQVIRNASEGASKNGNDPWILTIREAWLRTVALDFEGARRLCDTMIRSKSGYPKGQPKAIAWYAAANAALAQANYDEALQNFRQVIDKDVTPKFFLHWYWRMQAQLGLTNVWLASGNLRNARTEAARLLASALSTDDPSLQALAWEVNARVAIAEEDLKRAEERIQNGLSILAKFEIPLAAWRLLGTAWDLYGRLKNDKVAEAHRKSAETYLLKLANSFAPGEPLRATFLAAAPVRRILREEVGNKGPRRQTLRRGATS
ncbi:MAG TPA: AAA family ATPase [Candidatus Acidoferrum sp.]|nr:AAA family ATPase [Candidatus Acidoferrum sp.]